MLVGKTFVIEPDLFLHYPRNRAFVAGETDRPTSFAWLWVAVGVSAIVDCGLLLLGLGVLPVQLPESIREMQWIFLVMGVLGIPATIFMARLFGQIQGQGQLIEGRVTVADVRPSPSRPNRKIQYIKIEFPTPSGGREAAVIMRAASYPLPKVGTQAAILYAGPNRFRVL
jgi:hypothetical protein